MLAYMEPDQQTLLKGTVGILVLFMSLLTLSKMQFIPFIYFQF
jgi:hypothetical protein